MAFYLFSYDISDGATRESVRKYLTEDLKFQEALESAYVGYSSSSAKDLLHEVVDVGGRQHVQALVVELEATTFAGTSHPRRGVLDAIQLAWKGDD